MSEMENELYKNATKKEKYQHCTLDIQLILVVRDIFNVTWDIVIQMTSLAFYIRSHVYFYANACFSASKKYTKC